MQVAQLAVNLITALSWPVVIVLLLIYFGDDLREFVKNTNELRLKVPGLEGTLTRQLQSAAALGAATERQRIDGGGSASSSTAEADLRGIADTVSGAIQSKSARRIPGSMLLWVDDRPENNVYERKSLEALGIRITISQSTDDALNKVQSNRYDVIISDMGRPPDPQAGYTLLAELRRRKVDTPFIIYAGSNLLEHKRLARSKGALGSTNNPQELYQLVIAAIMEADT